MVGETLKAFAEGRLTVASCPFVWPFIVARFDVFVWSRLDGLTSCSDCTRASVAKSDRCLIGKVSLQCRAFSPVYNAIILTMRVVY